jgi:hypothetical protein
MTISDHNLSGRLAREQRAMDRAQAILVGLSLTCVLCAALIGVVFHAG